MFNISGLYCMCTYFVTTLNLYHYMHLPVLSRSVSSSQFFKYSPTELVCRLHTKILKRNRLQWLLLDSWGPRKVQIDINSSQTFNSKKGTCINGETIPSSMHEANGSFKRRDKLHEQRLFSVFFIPYFTSPQRERRLVTKQA